MRRYSAIAAMVCLVSLGAAARADIWRWSDAQGVVHYSDRPVPGAVLIKGRASNAATSETTDDQNKLDATSKQITADLNKEAAERAVQKDEAAARAAQCKQATDNYQKLIQARRIYNTDGSGQRQYLSDQQADQERLQARENMDNTCGSSTP
jgi:hypothetical protein